MIPKRKKLLLVAAFGCLAGLSVLIGASFFVMQTQWFADFLRAKTISVLEDSTGGKVEIRSFRFEPTRLMVRIEGLIIHGTEPSTAKPLAQITRLELHLKIFSGLKKAIDLASLAADQPSVNVIVNADGSTNIPAPKSKGSASSTSPLATIVDLAVGQFRIERGSLSYLQKTTPFSLRGDNLRVLLNYNSLTLAYAGNVHIEPLTIASGAGLPLAVKIDVPVTIERDGVKIMNARFTTNTSELGIDATLAHLNSPELSVHGRGKISLADLQNTLNVHLAGGVKHLPEFVNANLDASIDQSKNTVELRALHVDFGSSALAASGTLNPATGEGIRFDGNLVLAELARVLNLPTPQVAGDLHVKGAVRLDSRRNYVVTGALDSQSLSVQDGAARLSNVSLLAPFEVTPTKLSINPIQLTTLDGAFSGRVLIEEMRKLSAEGQLHNISIRSLTTALSGQPISYAGAISGSVNAVSDLQAKKNDLAVTTRLTISPGSNGIPVSGRLEARYTASDSQLKVNESVISLPHSRIGLAGALNQDLKVSLNSRDLNDFLPLANFGSAKPTKQWPLTLKGGSANVEAHVQGNLASPRVAAHAVVTQFAVGQSAFDQLSFDGAASSSGASIQNGALSQAGAQSNFNGSVGLAKWHVNAHSPLIANLTMKNADLTSLLALAGDAGLQASGLVDADIHVKGTAGNPLGGGTVQVVNGSFHGQPFADLQAQIDATDAIVNLAHFDMSVASGHINARGLFRHSAGDMSTGRMELHLKSSGLDLAGVEQMQRNNTAAKGLVDLDADATADLLKDSKQSTKLTISEIAANLSTKNLSVRNHNAGGLTASVRTVNGVAEYNVKSDFAGSNIHVDGHTALSHDYYTQANASIRSLALSDVLQIAGYSDLPIAGSLTVQGSFAGTMEAPDVRANLQLAKASLYQEPLNSLNATVRYHNSLAEISSLNLDSPAGRVNLSAAYKHETNAEPGSVQFKIHSDELQIARMQHLQDFEPGIGGTLQLDAELAGTVRQSGGSPSLLLSLLNADLGAQNLHLAKQDVGNLKISARTSQSRVKFQLDSNLAKSDIHASGESELATGYPTHLALTFNNVRYANVAPLLVGYGNSLPAFDGLVEGKASLNGHLTDFHSLQARMEVDRLDMHHERNAISGDSLARSTARLQNDGPLILSLNKAVLNIDQFRVRGPKTAVDLSGAANLSNSADSLRINLKASSDLGILQDVSQSFYSSGDVAIDAIVSGTMTQPVMNGKIELHKANINYADLPNGLSNGEGVILLSGKTASIQNLTGESGGGKITVDGFVGLSPKAVIYNLHAIATKVRTRYGSLSIVSNANVKLTGNSRRSLLNGKVTIQRVAYSSSSDLGSILTAAAAPPPTQAESSPLLANMRLDIGVATTSDVRVVTSYVEKLELTSNLQVRGTAAQPGVLGQINVADGQLTFFGNSYSVNKGSINFYDPSAIRPELNLSLETIAQGVDVVLGVTGPVSDMKLSYRSDPPLSFEQIVQLLATNTTPFDPTIAAHQPSAPQQSMSQMGESAVLGQAIANPLASRVQRVFGLSQFKVDPSVSGSNGQPTAKVTLQQKVASNLTFTYITDVTQSNSEIVRIQWDLGPKVSAVALRDYNGNVSIEMFYKFQVR